MIFRAERGVFPSPGPRTSRSPTRPASASSTASGARSGPRSTGRRERRRPADRLRPVAHGRRSVATRDGRARRRGRWPAPAGRTISTARSRRDEATPPGSPGGARARPGARGDEASGAPRPRRLDRLRRRPAARTTTPARAMAATGHARRSTAGRSTVDGHRLVRPSVGRLHLGRRRRLGLVRGEPRRRHRPHAVPRARRGRHLPARLRHARRADGTLPHLARDAFTSTSTDPGPARRPAPSTRPAGTSRSRARTSSIDARRRPSPTRSSTRGRRPASSTGRARRGHGDARRPAARRRGLCRADGLRDREALTRCASGPCRWSSQRALNSPVTPR